MAPPRLLPASLALAALSWAPGGVPAAAASRTGARRLQAAQPKDPYEPNDALGSISVADARNTETSVLYGLENVTQGLKKSSTSLDLTKLSCTDMKKILRDLEMNLEKKHVEAHMAKLEASSFNMQNSKKLERQKKRLSKALRSTEVQDTNKAATKTYDAYQDLTAQHFQVMEQYALKCSVLEPYCDKGHKYVLEEYQKLGDAREVALSLAVEAGWLAAESEQELATSQNKADADLAFQKANAAQGNVWDREESLAAAINVKAAVCGESDGPWSTPSDGCGRTPKDPLMEAMLREEPDEFYRHWRNEIGRKAGLDPQYVKVDVTGCFG